MNLDHQDLSAIADLVAKKISTELSLVTVSRWLTLDEAGDYAKLKRSTMLRLIQSGRIHAKKTSPGKGGWRVDRTSIDDWLNEGRIR